MCGINGFSFADKRLAEKMNTSIKHRGPDDEGVYIDNDMTLAMVRLAILDTSKRGAQPMKSDSDRYIIVHNGEVYNYQALRDELEHRGFRFKSNSDTEVILKAYEAYGVECVKKFNGMFAFAIWDSAEKKLFAARDHAGIKPFFYHYDGKKFIFSSELKGLLAHPLSKEIDLTSLNSFIRFSYINGPETIFKNIFSLPPGAFLQFQNNRLVIERYWHARTHNIHRTFEETKQLVRSTFDEAVSRQLVSDRPVGIFLGGGIDSTAILGSMAKSTNHKIKTFTVRFLTDVQGEKFNEDSDIARKTAQKFGTEHHELTVSAKDVVDNFESMVIHTDSLSANNSAIAPFMLSRLAKNHVAVVLGGDGGDELFGGYERYYHFHAFERLQGIPYILRNNFIVKNIAHTLGYSDAYKKINSSFFELFWMYRTQRKPLADLLLRPVLQDDRAVQDRYNKKYFTHNDYDYATELMKIDFQTWLVDESLSKSDGVTMAAGIEQRVPLLDKALVELALSIPSSYKINSRSQGKYVFKEAVKDYLPSEVYTKEKTGWFAPTAKWFRTDMKDMAHAILSPSYTKHTKDFFDFKGIEKVLNDHIEKKTYALNLLWSVMVFQVWYRNMMEE